MTQLENNQNKFNYLIKVSLIIYSIILLLAIMLKSFMAEDLIANFNFLSTFTLKERFIRGIRLIEFYKIEYELGILLRTIILDLLNCIIFIPFGIFISHYFKEHKVLKTLLIILAVSVIIEFIQLVTIIGSFMLNDIITNVIGGGIGSILYIILTNSKKYNIYNILLFIFVVIEVVLVGYLFICFVVNINIYKDIIMML
jgi:glycopeptide antibiotics resistance protein